MARRHPAGARGPLEEELADAVSRAATGKAQWSTVAPLLKAGARVEDPRAHSGPLVDLALAPAPVLRLALRNGAAVNPRFRKELPLVRAVRANLPDNVRLLLAAGARPNDRDDPRIGESAVDAWASWGLSRWTADDRAAKVSILKSLRAAGARLDCPGGMENAAPLWRLLLWHCVSKDPVDAPPVTSAKQFSRCEADLTVMLLKQGVDANARCPFAPERSGGRIPKGATPLFVRPVADGSLHRAILRAGGDPTLKAADGRTPIEFLEEYHVRLVGPRDKAVRKTTGRSLDPLPLFPDDPLIVNSVINSLRRRAALKK